MNGLNHELLPRETERELAIRAKNGCVESRNKLVEANLRLIMKEASHYPDPDESFGVGCVAAVEAIRTFNPDKGPLSAYLRPIVRRAMFKALPPEDEVSASLDSLSTEDVVEQHSVSYEVLDLLQDRFVAAELDEVDATIIALTYGLGGETPLSQREIAEVVDLSRARVRERHARAITRLRASFAAGGFTDWSDVLREIENE